MDMPTLEDILGRWGTHASRGNIAKHLGIKISGYAERIGGGSYAEWSQPVPDDVIEMDTYLQKMPGPIMQVIHEHYAVPGPVKTKIKGNSTAQYYAALGLAKRTLLDVINRSLVQNSSCTETGA